MTSNIGAKKMQEFGTGIGFKNNSYIEEEYKKDILKKELQKFFAPEFLNRVDEIVVFNNLKQDELKTIVNLELSKLLNRLNSLKYNIKLHESITELISEAGFDEKYGARPIKRAIQDKIEDFISEKVLKGNIKESVDYELYVDDKQVKLRESKPTKTKKTKKGE